MLISCRPLPLFSYIARHYSHDEEVVAEARLWQARCYSEMDWFYESEDSLGKLNTNGIPPQEPESVCRRLCRLSGQEQTV